MDSVFDELRTFEVRQAARQHTADSYYFCPHFLLIMPPVRLLPIALIFFHGGQGGDVLSSRLVSLNPTRYHRSSGFFDCEPSLRHGVIGLSASAQACTALAN